MNMKAWRVKFTVGAAAPQCIYPVDDGATLTIEMAAQKVRDALFPDVWVIPDTPQHIENKTVWQLECQDIILREVVRVDRWECSVAGSDRRQTFKGYVYARNLGDAEKRARKYLDANGMAGVPRDRITLGLPISGDDFDPALPRMD